jgi:hypothetical protein
MQRQKMNRARRACFCSVLALSVPVVLAISGARAEQPPPPCHPNPTADADEAAVRSRGDIVNLPGELQDRLALVADDAAYGRMCPLSGHSSCLPKVSWEGGEHSFVIRKRPLGNCNIHLHQG